VTPQQRPVTGRRSAFNDKAGNLKVYDSDTDESLNGSAPLIDNDEQTTEDGEIFDYSRLFEAPNYADFVKVNAPNSKAKGYELRTASILKVGLVGAINAQNYPDAATLLKYGPGFSQAAGNLAATDARAAALIDMVTAPDSPYLMFAAIAVPMISQLFRNHQEEIVEAGLTVRERRKARKQAKLSGVKDQAPPITVHLGKRRIKLPIRVRVKLPKFSNMFKAFLTPTQHPQQVAAEVFNDPAVIKALHKMGIHPKAPDGPE
jgi:hypothetical protein